MNTPYQQQPLIEWLSQAPHYPHSCTGVSRIETHISTVFLTGEWAYKLKKTVNFGFLDFTQLDARKTYCELELQLNRRTAPHIYQDVIAVYYDAHRDTFSFNAQPGLVICDYLVKMRQFDPDNVLSRLLVHHDLTPHHIDKLARAIASFHQQAQIVEPQAYWGSSACVLEPMIDNFPSLIALAQALAHSPNPPLTQRLAQLELWTRNQHTLLTPLIDQRKQQGFVRACHGDLHLDNIALIHNQPTLFDGIEFNEQFRWIDTLSDLAFLLIDLDARGKTPLSAAILNQYLRLSGDYAGLVLLRFYQTYRALVRAKISGLRYQQLDPSCDEAQQALTQLLGYIDLAETYAYQHLSQPRLYIMQGVSGSGKSHYAQQIHQQTGALIVSSDIERKRLFGIDPLHRVDDAARAQLYSAEMNRATYQAVYQACRSALQAGLEVIADATFLQAKHRLNLIELAHSYHIPYVTICIQPNPSLAAQWITQRQQQNQDPSDANIEVMTRQLQQFEYPQANECHLLLKMQQPLPDLATFWNNAC